MSKVSPYHTKTEEEPGQADVHHNHDDCREGKKIKSYNKEQGTNNKRLCKICSDLG
jgi:hypothetical protein